MKSWAKTGAQAVKRLLPLVHWDRHKTPPASWNLESSDEKKGRLARNGHTQQPHRSPTHTLGPLSTLEHPKKKQASFRPVTVTPLM